MRKVCHQLVLSYHPHKKKQTVKCGWVCTRLSPLVGWCCTKTILTRLVHCFYLYTENRSNSGAPGTVLCKSLPLTGRVNPANTNSQSNSNPSGNVQSLVPMFCINSSQVNKHSNQDEDTESYSLSESGKYIGRYVVIPTGLHGQYSGSDLHIKIYKAKYKFLYIGFSKTHNQKSTSKGKHG